MKRLELEQTRKTYKISTETLNDHRDTKTTTKRLKTTIKRHKTTTKMDLLHVS